MTQAQSFGASDLGAEGETIPVFARWYGSWRISLQRRAFSPPQLRHSYDRAAPGWNRRLARLGVPDAYEALLRDLLREDMPQPKGERLRILDCGVGSGALSSALARTLPVLADLDAIDLSSGMLERASETLRDSGLAVSLRQGDIRHLPYGSGSFDFVMSAHVLEHLPDPGHALAEMVRVLRPGGQLLACLTRRSPLGRCIQLAWRTHGVTAGEAEAWLSQQGLESVRCRPMVGSRLYRQLSLACFGRKPA